MTALPEEFGPSGGGFDPYPLWDAAYVLGALSPAERMEFEGHLDGCPRCRGAIADLAGIPGLLAQVGPEDLVSPDAEQDPLPPLPPRILPEVLAEARRPGGRLGRTGRVLLGLAAAVLLLLGGVALGTGHRPGTDGPQRVAFSPVVTSDITAVVDLVPLATGTDVRVECQYGGSTDAGPTSYPQYAIVVTDRAGRESSIKEWPVRAGTVMHPSAPTPLSIDDIRQVEIRAASTNETVLRATLP